MKLRFAVPCEFAREGMNKKADLFGVFDTWQMADPTTEVAPPFMLFAMFEREEGEAFPSSITVSVQTYLSDSEQMAGGAGPLEISMPAEGGITLVMQVTDFRPKQYGRFTMKIVLGDQSYPCPDLYVKPPPAQVQNG